MLWLLEGETIQTGAATVVVVAVPGTDLFRRQAVPAERCCWQAIRCLSVVAEDLQTNHGFVSQTSSTPLASINGDQSQYCMMEIDTILLQLSYDGDRYGTVLVALEISHD